MKASKRLLASLMAGALCVTALAGCGGSGSGSSSTGGSATASGSSSGSSDAEYKISFIVKHTDEHFERVMAGASAYCEDNPNVSVEFNSPTSSADYDGQTNMVETTLSSGSFDAMIVAPLQSDTVANLVANATIPVVACDTDFTSDKKVTFVGTGNEDAAKEGGKAATEAAIAKGIEKPTAVILTGVQGDETHEARLAGYKAGVEEAGGEVLEVQYTDAMPDKAATSMEAVIQKYPDGVDIVLSTGDDMAMSAMKVIQDSGGDAFADTIICGYDGNKSAIEAIQNGTLTMTVAQQGYDMGYKAMEAAVKAIEGEKVDDFIDSGATVVSTDTVDEYVSHMKELGVWDN